MSENTAAFAGLTLEWNDFYWVGRIPDLDPLGKEFELHIETKDEEMVEPHSLQVELWQRIVGSPQRYREMICEELFKHYCEVRPDYEQMGAEWVAQMPVLTRKEEIRDLIRLNSISIRWPYEGTPPSVGFSYGCQWDREHGAGIILQGDEVTDLGGADVLYLS